eukprot:124289-Prorocentrum_minimum.AAC.1
MLNSQAGTVNLQAWMVNSQAGMVNSQAGTYAGLTVDPRVTSVGVEDVHAGFPRQKVLHQLSVTLRVDIIQG